MAQRIPVDFTAEYRGTKPASQFTRRDTGEVIAIPAKLKFELSRENGDVENVELSGTVLDRCTPPFDYSALKRGDEVRLSGVAVIQDRDSDKQSFLSIETAEPAGKSASKLAVAS